MPPGGYQASAPPAYPQQTSGGGYPGYPQPPQRGRSYLVPLVALASTLVVLVVAIVIVVAVRGGDEDPIAGPTTAAPTSRPVESQSAAAGGVDQCLVGTWRVTSHKEDVDLDDVGKVTFIGGEGATLKLNADGSGEADYGSGTEYQGSAGGRTYKLEVSGRLTFDYTGEDGSAEFTDVQSRASGKLFIDGEQYGDSIPFNAEEDSWTYTCSSSLLTQKTFLYTTEYERVS